MKPKFLLGFLLPFAFVLGPAVAAAPTGTPPPKSDLPELAVVVVDTLARRSSAYTDFDRLDLAFQLVAERRHWPVRIAAERFAANTPAHDPELRVFLQPIHQELPGEFKFGSWMTLTEHGIKHDLGIVVYRYRPRAGEQMDDALERMFRGAAGAAAEKIEPILFPNLPKPKP